MTSNTDTLRAYQEKQPPEETAVPGSSSSVSSIAGGVQTSSIRDLQVDYLTIVRESATSYHVALAVDSIPLYRIEATPITSKVGDFQLFSKDSTLPIAAARLSPNPKSKTEPLAFICTSSPTLPHALWRPFTRASTFSVCDYRTNIPIVTIPGRPAQLHQFSWRTGNLSEPYYQLLWDGPLPLVPAAMFKQDQRGLEYVFATLARKTADGEDNLVEVRRGGGIDFELGVILELFVILHLKKVQLPLDVLYCRQ